LVPLVIIGVSSTYSDLKYGKIKNKLLLYATIYFLVLYSFLGIYNFLILQQNQNIKYLLLLMINGGIAFVVSYAMWHLNLWAAGDAKLFTLYAFLIPLESYAKLYVPFFPSLILLIYTFFFAFSFFIVQMVIMLIKFGIKKLKQEPKFLTKKLKTLIVKRLFSKHQSVAIKKSIGKIGELGLVFIGYFIPLQYIRGQYNDILLKFIPDPFVVQLLFFALQVLLLRTLFKHKVILKIVIMIGLVFSLFIVLLNNINVLLGSIKTSLPLMVAILVGIKLVDLYIKAFEMKKIFIKDLKVGSFLTPLSLVEIKTKLQKISPKDNIKIESSDGLGKQQIQFIQNLFVDDPQKEVYIYKTLPFAPFLFLSFIVLAISLL